MDVWSVEEVPMTFQNQSNRSTCITNNKDTESMQPTVLNESVTAKVVDGVSQNHPAYTT
jgi:hypothetical protein